MKKSFVNPVTGVLTACGFADYNGGDTPRDEPDDFALEPGKWRLVGDEWVAISPDPNEAILAQIAAIEQATMVPRLVREGLIVMAEDLAEREAAKLTADGTPTTKEELLAANIGYQKTKTVDEQIRALRSQLK